MKAKTASQFYEFSSRNRVGGRTHPVVLRRRNKVLNMYADLMTMDEISMSLDISVDTVKHYIRRAKRIGDPRAIRPMNRKVWAANVRKRHIRRLAAAGFSTQEIAKRLNVHPRLVQMRLKEAAE